MPRSNVRRPSIAVSLSTIALFVALGGGAYAAAGNPFVGNGGTIQGCVKKGVLDVARVGKRCPKHSRPLPFNEIGPQGPQGKQGIQGIQGVPGPPGPVTGMAPSGLTQRGMFYIDGYAEAGNYLGTSISFPLELATAPKPVEVPAGGPNPDPTHCSGTVDAPSAAPGYLCIYDSYSGNAASVVPPFLLLVYNIHAQGGASPFGASLLTYAVATGDAYVAGSWAVTSP